MPRDIRNTKKNQELFEILGDMSNPTVDQFATLFARHKDAPEKYPCPCFYKAQAYQQERFLQYP